MFTFYKMAQLQVLTNAQFKDMHKNPPRNTTLFGTNNLGRNQYYAYNDNKNYIGPYGFPHQNSIASGGPDPKSYTFDYINTPITKGIPSDIKGDDLEAIKMWNLSHQQHARNEMDKQTRNQMLGLE